VVDQLKPIYGENSLFGVNKMPQSEWIGKKLGGRYEIEELLGQGGMSAVYKAMDPNLKRIVAVKMIHAHLSNDPGFVMRFEEEAAAVAKLRHPYIVQVYDFDHDDGTYYMVLEFVPGETLQDYLKRLNKDERYLPTKQAIHFAANVSDAIDYAHLRGLIHRDIKPANVMINVQGEAILMDFGIAKIIGGQKHTATGAVVGTAMYMSPEQIKGEQPDRRTDIYSLGVTLFEMVSGHPPFEADSAMTLMMMHVNDPVPDLRRINPEVPDGLVGIINKALAKDPDERYQTAAQMATALRNLQASLTAGASTGLTPPEATFIEQSSAGSFTDGATMIEPAGGDVISPEGTLIEPTPIPTEPPMESASRSVATSTGQSRMRPAPAEQVPGAPPSQKRSLPLPLIGGGIIVVLGLICLIGGYFAYNQFLGGGLGGAASKATNTVPVVAIVETTQPSEVLTPTETPTPVPPTNTPPPTETPTQTLTPTATVPVGIPFSRINNITIDNQGRYVVEYETFEFTEKLPGMHVHFFFNTVPPEQAGVPGSGPWILYGGPRPFTGYKVSDRPQGATQMCILVANPDHTVQANSGNCYDLPEG
jgi:serine/threonine protein kinase